MSEVEQPTMPLAPIRVMIASPCGDQVSAGYAHDLAMLVGGTAFNRPDIEVRIAMEKGTLLPAMRTRLVYDALQHNCTHIMFIDSDMRFPPYLLGELLRHGEPIVGVNYIARRFPLRPTAFTSLDPIEPLWTEPESTGLVSVASIGFGAVLIDLDIFRYMPQPWFNVEWVEKLLGERKTGTFQGEDVYFCAKCVNAGVNVLVDQALSQHIQHEGSWEYSHDHALAQRDAIQFAKAQENASARHNELRDAASSDSVVAHSV
jgi:hypothetical protein